MHYYSDLPASNNTLWLPNLRDLPKTIRDRFTLDGMLFEKFAGAVSDADYVDMDYDSISQAVVVTIHWSESPRQPEGGWTESISVPDNESTIEIGVLSHESNSDPEDIQFGGFLTVLGRDDSPSKSTHALATRIPN
jgi:hypothetical protein